MRKLKVFKCEHCKHEQELVTDKNLTDCSKCGFASHEIKTYSTSRPIFKGEFPGEKIRKGK